MAEHPIQGLMQTAMENIKEMVDVNTIVGDPVETPDGTIILPISKVGFGFAAGGSEFSVDKENDKFNRNDTANASVALPFGGGSGGGVSITPIAFLVVGAQGVKVVPLDHSTHLFERIIDSVPQLVDKVQSLFKGSSASSMGMDAGMTPMMGTSSMQPPTPTPPPGSGSNPSMAGSTPSSTSSKPGTVNAVVETQNIIL